MSVNEAIVKIKKPKILFIPKTNKHTIKTGTKNILNKVN